MDPVALIPHPRNPNTHPASQVELLAKVINHQGWRSPIIVSKRSGFVVSGHGRLLAALSMHEPVVPVNDQEFATEADEWAHLIADNRLAELSEINEGVLKGVITALGEQHFDLDLVGFDAAAVATLTSEPQQPDPPEDFPEVDETISTESECPKCGYKWSGGTIERQ
ncbi:MAG: hypothetical protein OEV64_07425 [Desulfobulbaceae bacterium]|nr:hypothetical protein [Desulfobulbaceae bacterium]